MQYKQFSQPMYNAQKINTVWHG